MSRYLTPSKIGLLVLVSIYCDSNVPNRSLIPVLSFVLSQLTPPSSSAPNLSSKENPSNHVLTIADFELATRVHQSIRPGRSIFDLLVHGLWSIETLHGLHEFFGRLEEYVTPKSGLPKERPFNKTILSRTSPLGIFLRRAQLEFMRLQFNDAAKLWSAFLKFRAPTEPAWRKRNPVAAGPTFDAAIAEFDVQQPHRLALAAYGVTDAKDLEDATHSLDDLERILDFDLDKIQRFGTRVPKTMHQQLESMIEGRTSTPHGAYFARFFDAWRAGDFTGAFENLHRYFDYTVRARDKSFYQYALLHMAILQADFGCFDEAIASMNETIATARENQDTSCLNFSLSWLSHLNRTYPNLKKAGYAGMLGSEKDRLHFLAEKAKETKSWPLLSSTLLSEAKLVLSLGGDPSSVNERLYQSAHLNYFHHVFSNCSTQLLIESSLHARTGLNLLADNNCEVILDCYAQRSPVEEIVRATGRRVYGAAYFGFYTKADSFLEAIDPNILRTMKHNQYVLSYSGLVKMRQALRKHDLVAAEHILSQLQGGTSSDPDLQFQIAILEIDYLVRLGSTAEAFTKLARQVEIAETARTDVIHLIILLLIKADLWARVGKAGKGFTIILRAAGMAHRYKLFPLLWEAMGTLANVLMFFGEFEHASKLLDAVIPQVLGTNDTAVVAVLYDRQSDATLGLTEKAPANSRERAKLLSKTDEYVDKALEMYAKLQDVRGQCEMMFRKAGIAKSRGDIKVAEDWATKYLTLYDQHFGRDADDIM